MFCCDMMSRNVFCADNKELKESKTIFYSKRFDEYLIPVSEDGVSGICMTFCPWCGKKLPESKRKRWFDELDQMGIEFSLFDTTQVPLPYLSDAWWQDNDKDCQ